MSAPPGAILACVDGSADSERAVEWAAAEAAHRRAPLHLIYALELSVVVPAVAFEKPPVPFLTADKERRQQYADQAISDAAATADRYGAPVTSEIVAGAAAPVILAVAEPALMIVLGSRGHGAVAGLVLGSVSQHVSRHAHCPVIVVKEQTDRKARRIIVGTDGSPSCDKAIGFAFDIASRRQAPLTAIYAWRDITEITPGGPSTFGMKNVAERITTGEQVISESVASWVEKYPEVETSREAIPVHPVRALADASEHAALMVVGSRGRGAFTGLLLGSVSQELLHHARCPVAVVR